MPYMPFGVGQVTTNAGLVEAFRVGNMGGMRKSNQYKCLVLISDHTKGLYDDKWYGDVLHYTGMGKTGDQVLAGNQNGTVFYSATNGVTLHLFEVLEATKYTYRGIVELAGDPYQEQQVDTNGNSRKVWMFPLRSISGTPILSAEEFHTMESIRQSQAKHLDMAALEQAAKASETEDPGTRIVQSTEYVRNQNVSEYVKKRANGVCALCGKPAPFSDKDGDPYLETHHVIWLAHGGADTITNAVALCPNCHRKMHVLNNPSDVNKLLAKARNN